ncbi:MAG TPA: hypothetical protein VJ901_14850 [Thermoanaerobaculia bacterium]|nr:hypothetical protein [Thermoanaerobaculia bacterium]
MSDVDYSDRAIALRIHQVSQLRKLCLSLANAKRLSPPEGEERRKSDRDESTSAKP